MIVILFFVLTIMTGFYTELAMLFPIKLTRFITMSYFMGTLFFLFVTENHILKAGFINLMIINIIDYIIRTTQKEDTIKKWGKYEALISIAILLQITFHTFANI